MIKNNIYGWPIYEFESSLELADDVLKNATKLNFLNMSKVDKKITPLTIGYNKNPEGILESFYHEELYSWIRGKIQQISDIHFENLKLDISDIWVVKSIFGQSSDIHTHALSVFSGVYYLQDCERSETQFYFHDLFHKAWYDLLGNHLKKENFIYKSKPKKGKLIVWPSNISHKVLPHSGKDTRYSVAFNTFFDGVISDTPSEGLEISLIPANLGKKIYR